jgi:protein-tyrosine phosphatase
MAGQYPGARDEIESRLRLHWLLEQGVTACLDLTEEADPELKPYAALWIEEAASMGVFVCHIRCSIPDFSTPSPEHMRNILDNINMLLKTGEVVYLHCHGGIGRTGMTVACYLVRHGLSAESALAQLASLRKATPYAWKSSPETDEQWRFVLDWDS